MERIKNFMFNLMGACAYFMLGCICFLLGVDAFGIGVVVLKRIIESFGG